MDKNNVRFLFVTSSKHKLLQGAVRDDAVTCTLHSLSAEEIGSSFVLERALNRGLLPHEYSNTYNDDSGLLSYLSQYLQEEIAPCAGADHIPKFHRLLMAMAKHNGELINYADLAAQTAIPRTTVQEWVQLVLDTGLAYELPPWTRTVRRAIRTSKIYLFDSGLARILQDQDKQATPRDKCATPFQHWVFHELRCFADFIPTSPTLNHWRSAAGHAVDYILGEETAIAANGSSQVGTFELKGLRWLREEHKFKRYCLVCCEPTERVMEGIEILPYMTFMRRLWNCELI